VKFEPEGILASGEIGVNRPFGILVSLLLKSDFGGQRGSSGLPVTRQKLSRFVSIRAARFRHADVPPICRGI
jgi:hypothetical protein